MDQTHKLSPGFRVTPRKVATYLLLAATGAFIALFCCVCLPGCNGPGNASPAPASSAAATPSPLTVIDVSGDGLGFVTTAVAGVVQAEPALKPYVQSVANFLHAHATDQAPAPAEVSAGLGLLTAVVPDLTKITGPINAWYASHYATVTAAESAGPLVEQLAGAVEAGATPAS